jgi:uncharacterized phage-associated protein
MERAMAVANYFIRRGMKDGKSITPMKLQKLVYFAHGWHLALFNEPLIDEAIQVWQYGPVVPTIYHEFKHLGNKDITSPYKDLLGKEPQVAASKEEFLDVMWDQYSDLTGVQLSNLTHQPNTPWDVVYRRYTGKGLPLPKGLSLDDEKIKEYFDQEYQALEK